MRGHQRRNKRWRKSKSGIKATLLVLTLSLAREGLMPNKKPASGAWRRNWHQSTGITRQVEDLLITQLQAPRIPPMQKRTTGFFTLKKPASSKSKIQISITKSIANISSQMPKRIMSTSWLFKMTKSSKESKDHGARRIR